MAQRTATAPRRSTTTRTTPRTGTRTRTASRGRKAVVRRHVVDDDSALVEREHDAFDAQLLDALHRLCA